MTLEAFRAAPECYDVVVTDQTMPKLTGAEIARQVLKIRPGCPVIVCTGYSDVFDEEYAKASGIAGHTEKPLTVRELATAIRNVLEKRDED